MRNKLIFFCDKAIEIGWLSAAIIVPLFFNIHSDRIFEPDKITLLRSIALMMSVIWAIKAVENFRTRQGKAVRACRIRLVSFWQKVYKTPLVLPVLLLVLAYIVSTALSVAPRVSLLGSYKRLQGTYTTLSYIVIFFLIIQGLRTRRQLNRLITVSILVSFPIALYGLLQHFGLDPLPWGTIVKRRAISSMGGSIFLAAYLIMIVPLSLSRLLENWKEVAGGFDTLDGVLGIAAIVLPAGTMLGGLLMQASLGPMWILWLALLFAAGLQITFYFFIPAGRLPRVLAVSLPLSFAFLLGFCWTLEIFLPPSTSNYLWLGLLVALMFMLSMAALALFLRKPISRLLLVGSYFVILITQLVCIFYTQSRGPMIGLLAGVFLYFWLLGLLKQKVWISWMISSLAIAVIIFLVIVNTVNVPFTKSVQKTPYVGRLSKLFQTGGTARVRLLIWKGVTKMVYWHPALEYPGENGGPDALNSLRPFIGYGPESMYLAYNRFYLPELAQYEDYSNLADRSHNETFDALVTTGAFGFLVYMFLSASLFYFGLKWLGLIRKRRQKLAFLGLWVGGGIVGGIGAWLWLEPMYIGVGIPGGLILGLVTYVFISMLRPDSAPETRQSFDGGYSLWMLALVSAMVAHFIEIHIGIAVAATRTYFWIYAAMMVAIGTRLASGSTQTQLTKAETANRAKDRKKLSVPSPQALQHLAGDRDWHCSFLFLSIAALLILNTMLFEFITVQSYNLSLLPTIWNSLTHNKGVPSLGVLALLLATWGMICVMALSDLATQEESAEKKTRNWLGAAGIFTMISLGGSFIFALLYTLCLKPGTMASFSAKANAFSFYCLFVFLLILSLTLLAGSLSSSPTKLRRWTMKSGDVGEMVFGITLIVAAGIIIAGNINIIRADIFYKQGLIQENMQHWDEAIFLYKKAIKTERKQDYYYLFLARAYLGKSKSSSGPARETWLRESEKVLIKASKISPLHFEHSINLARFYTIWGMASNGKQRIELLKKALTQFAVASNISPNNAQIYNEWGKAFFVLGDNERALEMYKKSLSLDHKYLRTYIFLGELYISQKKWVEAAETFQRGIEIDPELVDAHTGLGYVSMQMGDIEAALHSYHTAVILRPKDFNLHINLAILYRKKGENAKAISEAKKALSLAPDDRKDTIQTFLNQLNGLP